MRFDQGVTPVGGLYDVLKGQAYGIASIASGRSNAETQALGFKDICDLIMSDGDHDRQRAFLHLLMHEMPGAYRKVLLDGLVKEYADLDGWMAYVDRENS